MCSNSASAEIFSVQWPHTPITVQIDVAPFARGALRMVYHMVHHMVECSVQNEVTPPQQCED